MHIADNYRALNTSRERRRMTMVVVRKNKKRNREKKGGKEREYSVPRLNRNFFLVVRTFKSAVYMFTSKEINVWSCYFEWQKVPERGKERMREDIGFDIVELQLCQHKNWA